jgi:hypothetical protein
MSALGQKRASLIYLDPVLVDATSCACFTHRNSSLPSGKWKSAGAVVSTLTTSNTLPPLLAQKLDARRSTSVTTSWVLVMRPKVEPSIM